MVMFMYFTFSVIASFIDPVKVSDDSGSDAKDIDIEHWLIYGTSYLHLSLYLEKYSKLFIAYSKKTKSNPNPVKLRLVATNFLWG